MSNEERGYNMSLLMEKNLYSTKNLPTIAPTAETQQ